LKEYLAAGGAEYADVVGFHFYVTPDDPEAMLSVIDTVRAVLVGTRLQHHPVWNTESGWLLQNHDTPVVPSGATGTFASRVLDDSTGAAFVVRALVLGRCGSLSRFYWYAWDNRRMGLTEADGIHLKVEAQAYQTARQWLRGARVTVCERTTDGVWIVRMSRGKGVREAIVWSTAAATSVSLADGSSVVSEWPLLGAEHRGADNRSGVSIHGTGAPTLVRYR
jgi:hypothetical protein